VTVQDELAVEDPWWWDVFGKHCMNEFRRSGAFERKLMAGGEISPDPAHKGMLSDR
jgi:hypothetical protein